MKPSLRVTIKNIAILIGVLLFGILFCVGSITLVHSGFSNWADNKTISGFLGVLASTIIGVVFGICGILLLIWCVILGKDSIVDKHDDDFRLTK
jgi:TRAP-type C4-dicarboxylate transport system permease small subunit